MAPVKAAKAIKLTVPRHNAQRINAKMSVEIRKQGKVKGVLVETTQASSRLSQAIESASEWNSLLMTARAARGPQWDVGTQQFFVDKGSELHYDPTALYDAVKKATEDEDGEESTVRGGQPQMQPQHHQMPTQQQQHTFQVQPPPQMATRSSHHTPRRDIPPDYGMPSHLREHSPHRMPSGGGGGGNMYGGSPGGMNAMNMGGMGMGMRGPPGGGGQYANPPFNPAAGGYMGGDLSSGGSPMRMGVGGMGNMMTGGGMRPQMGMPNMGNMGGGMSSGGGGGMGGIPGGGGGGMGNMGGMGMPMGANYSNIHM